VARISEQDINKTLQGMETPLGEGIDCRNMQLKVRREGITLSAIVQIAQLQNAVVPMQVLVRPVVREERLRLQVLDVQLGGPFAAISNLVKPMLTTGIAEAFDANSLLTPQGMRISSVELEDGYVVVTTVPDS